VSDEKNLLLRTTKAIAGSARTAKFLCAQRASPRNETAKEHPHIVFAESQVKHREVRLQNKNMGF
jgi:hypothetical protein